MKPRRALAATLGAGLLAAGALPASAAATVEIDPPSLSFGAQKVGVASPMKTVTITVSCTEPGAGFCQRPDSFDVSPVIGGQNPADFGWTENCPPVLAPELLGTASCEFQVGFRPSGSGPRSASLQLGYGSDPPLDYFLDLSGSGSGAASKGKGKKCKKGKKGAATAKKKRCKKKKKKK
jgi:hypothetical protein